jgi:hypothetical protein
MIKRVVLLLVFLLAAAPAHAALYARPTWDNLLKTLVRYGALDLSEDRILDEYAIVTECDLYRYFYGNDLKWNKVRESIRDSVELNLNKFPSGYVYEDKLLLDRYDFQQQVFLFSEKYSMLKVNAFFLYRTNGHICNDTLINYMPRSFRAVLDESVTVPGLPLTPRSADDLVRRMDANKNKERAIYVRFNLHINYVSKVIRNPTEELLDTPYRQKGSNQYQPVIMNAQIDTIDFYEDEGRTKLLYSYQL